MAELLGVENTTHVWGQECDKCGSSVSVQSKGETQGEEGGFAMSWLHGRLKSAIGFILGL